MRVRRFYCDLFLVSVFLYVGKPDDCARRIRRSLGYKLDLSGTQGLTATICNVDNEHCFLIYLDPPVSVETLTHEVYHLCDQIFSSVGVKTRRDDEILPYYMEYWLRRIGEVLKRSKRVKKA